MLCTGQDHHPNPTSTLGILHMMPPTSNPTAEAQLLREEVVPENVYPLQLLPESQVHRIDNSPFPAPIVQPQALGDKSPHLQQNRFGDCPHCSQIWLTHCKCIFKTSFVSDSKENGQRQLNMSFQELEKHIQEHWVASGTSCCLCQDHFSNHLLVLQLLSKVNLEDPRHFQIGMDLRQGVIELREHVREKHGFQRGQGSCEEKYKIGRVGDGYCVTQLSGKHGVGRTAHGLSHTYGSGARMGGLCDESGKYQGN